MLVLSRKAGQRIVLGNEIVITILKVRGSYVRIGIEAPASVAIRREELVETAPLAEDDSPYHRFVATAAGVELG